MGALFSPLRGGGGGFVIYLAKSMARYLYSFNRNIPSIWNLFFGLFIHNRLSSNVSLVELLYLLSKFKTFLGLSLALTPIIRVSIRSLIIYL